MQTCHLQHPAFSCPKEISEDCLYLNVYTPRTKQSKVGNLPVLLFMHGGNYISGSGGVPFYDGSKWANLHQVMI